MACSDTRYLSRSTTGQSSWRKAARPSRRPQYFAMFLSWMSMEVRQTRTKPKSGQRNTSGLTATRPMKWIRHSKIGKLNGHGARGRGLAPCPDASHATNNQRPPTNHQAGCASAGTRVWMVASRTVKSAVERDCLAVLVLHLDPVKVKPFAVGVQRRVQEP